MGNILTANVQVVGVRPLLWHAFGPDAMPLEKREKTGVAGNDPEEWKRTVLVTKEGQLYLRPTYAFGAIREASRYTKVGGKGTLQKSMSATLQVTSDIMLVDRWLPAEPLPTDPDELVYLDIQGVRNPATKGRNVRYRVAASTGWKTSFDLLWDKTLVSLIQMESVLIDAGRLVGFGDGRSIGYGRFELESFEVEDA